MVETLKNAVYQNINEVGEALFYLNALVGMSEPKIENKILFLTLAEMAMKNDMMSHLMRILDKTKNTASFWYIYKKEKDIIDEYADKESINLAQIKELASNDRLYLMRNKSHFHIDKGYTYNQGDAWKDSNISSQEIKSVLESLLHILGYLFQKYEGVEFPDFDFSDPTAAAVVDVANRYIEIK